MTHGTGSLTSNTPKFHDTNNFAKKRREKKARKKGAKKRREKKARKKARKKGARPLRGAIIRLSQHCCTELYYITGESARGKKVKPKTWRIFLC